MFISLRTFIIVFLVMLQFIAPLVHAHTGEKIFDKGFHVPGLEVYELSQDVATLQMSSYHIDSEGVLVGVNTGLKAKQSITLDDTDVQVYITPPAVVLKITLFQFDTNFSPHFQHIAVQTLASAHSARAPPQ
ncbi:hypothetical protein [Crenothrix sp.]|uniref:hypothetical protein n=1 Tax=Crenothrix sp. TaxID=3100433 RepID=UPI00374C9C45